MHSARKHNPTAPACQGPPGCGGSFIHSILLNLLFNLSTYPYNLNLRVSWLFTRPPKPLPKPDGARMLLLFRPTRPPNPCGKPTLYGPNPQIRVVKLTLYGPDHPIRVAFPLRAPTSPPGAPGAPGAPSGCTLRVFRVLRGVRVCPPGLRVCSPGAPGVPSGCSGCSGCALRVLRVGPPGAPGETRVMVCSPK
jgi:hypothetical protein